MKYEFDENTKIVHISVREMCEFVFRSGSIYSGGTDISGEAMLKGIALHKKLQKEREKQYSGYKSEYRMQTDEEVDGFTYDITGILDGVYPNGDGSIIDEFKTTSKKVDELSWDSIMAYSAQLMCYGYMYCLENSLNFITLRLTYYNAKNDETQEIEKEFTFTYLRTWFCDLVSKHCVWSKLVYEHKMKRNESARELSFPFGEYRKGQRQLCAKIYRNIRNSTRLFAEAPTGIGKTVSSLFPSVKALGENYGEKIFYLSAKTVGAKAACDCADLLCEKGACLKSIHLTAKEKICPFEKNCLPSECEYSDGHYDRVNEALFELVSKEGRISQEELLAVAHKHKVCPFELQLDASEFCDIVIGDYNYFFDPKAHLARFFSDGGDYIILCDEAHNLVDRAREMFTARLSLFGLGKYVKKFGRMRKLPMLLRKCIDVLNNIRADLSYDGKDCMKVSLDENKLLPFRMFCEAYRQMLSDEGHDEVKKATLEVFFEISFFVEIFDTESIFKDSYEDYAERSGDNLTLSLFCADPSELIKLASGKARSCIFFSATLSPYNYFLSMLGYDEEAKDEMVCVPSPFPRENLFCAVYKNISTRFKDRENSLEQVCEVIGEACCARRGNYMAFFPSYSYMTMCYDHFTSLYPDIKVIIQSPEMTKEQRDEFLGKFQVQDKEVFVAFALVGGIFSEGVDLVGERLSGAVIVGTGLPSISFERDLIKQHFDKSLGTGIGYNYAYTYTGLNRVFQAGGRVIRTQSDKGFVVLCDDRYMNMTHRRSFPEGWRGERRFATVEALTREIKSFWEKN